jgi:DNA modification methylase
VIHHGDLFDVLPTLAESSIDACVTDPPYGIGFMGKQWDSFSPLTAQRKAGMRQCGQLPRAKQSNPNLKGRTVNGAISTSQIEYDMGLAGLRGFQDWTARWATEVHRVLKPGAYLVVCGAPRSHHRMMCGLEDAGFVVRDCFAWLFGSGFPKNKNLGDGRGTALKPAHEPIALAWKPFKGTITANVSAFGTGALNIDACRLNPGEVVSGGGNGKAHNGGRFGAHETSGSRPVVEAHDLGRWPANVLLGHSPDCGEDQDGDWRCVRYCPVWLLDDQTGELTSGAFDCKRSQDGPNRAVYGGFPSGTPAIEQSPYQGDRGGASRFYYVAKPSREERDYGTEGLIERQRDDSRKEGNPGGDNPRNRGLQPRGNFHPTVKPVELMRWLVKLVTPPGGRVLDPFTGSGTTGMACRYELREFIGIEREAEYLAIAERRIAGGGSTLCDDGGTRVRPCGSSSFVSSMERNRGVDAFPCTGPGADCESLSINASRSERGTDCFVRRLLRLRGRTRSRPAGVPACTRRGCKC